MAGSNNNNKDQGLFIILFMAIFGTLMGIHKMVKNAGGRNAELDKMNTLIREKLQSGSTDEEIIQSFYDDAEDQFGKTLTHYQKDRIKAAYAKERATISEGDIDASHSAASPTALDSQLRTALLSIGNIVQGARPFLKFDALFQKAKECEAKGDFVDLHLFINKEQDAIESMWRACAALERDIDGIMYYSNSTEPESARKKRQEFSKVKNFTTVFTRLLAQRGKIFRQVGIMYNGRNKREATAKREADELRVLKATFQSDIDRMAAEMDIFNGVMERINKQL